MDIEKLRPIRRFLLFAAIAGFVLINIPFLYYFFNEAGVYDEAMNNGIALVFMGEALFLMLFFAFMIAKLGLKKPGWIFFIIMSLLGSMAFSIPLQLYLMTKPKQSERGNG